jgi:hypothetical protein
MINDSATLQGGGLEDLTIACALGCRVRASRKQRRGMRSAGACRTARVGARRARLRHSAGQRGIVKSALASAPTHDLTNADADARRTRMFSRLRAGDLHIAQAGTRRPVLTRTDAQLPVSKARRSA